MSETMKVALTFTAIDAASGYIAGLEKRIDSLGEAGDRARAQFEAMKVQFADGLKGIGVAWSTVKFMTPGIEAAAAMEASGIALKNSLAGGSRNAAQMAEHFKAMRSTALYLSAHSPFAAPELMRAQKLLMDAGFQPEDIAGRSGLAAQVAGLGELSGLGPDMARDLAEIFNQQFGAGPRGIADAFDWIAKSGMEDKLPDLARGLASMGTRAAAMKIPMKEAVSTISLLEHVAKNSGPAIGAFLKNTRPDAASSQAVRMRDIGLEFYNEQGNFIGLAAAQELLKKKFGGIQGDRMKMLEEIFGEGALAAEGLIKAQSLDEVFAQTRQRMTLQEQVTQLNKGLTRSYEDLVKAIRNSSGSVFAPVTGMLAAAARGGRDVFGWMGERAEKNPWIGHGVAAAGGLVGGSAVIFAAVKMLAAFRNLTSVAGATAGIVAGKAVEKATGVTPVFVTNWPPSLGSAAALTAAGALSAGTAAGSVAGGLAGTAKAVLTAGSLAKIASMGAMPMLLAGTGVAAAGMAGWAVGSWLNNFIPNSETLDRMAENYGYNQEREKQPVVINLTVDKYGRVMATGDANTDFEVKSSRGSFLNGD